MQEEAKETQEKIDNLEMQIEKLKKRISEMESGEVVKDKVKGGLGGIQSFTIEGFPNKEYSQKKSSLMAKQLLLNQRKAALQEQEVELIKMTKEVEKFIHEIKDSRIRRIINLRFIDGLSWFKVSEKIDKNSTADGVRMEFNRFMKNI